MKFIPGKHYFDRRHNIWLCVKPIFGNLPTFTCLTLTIVQNVNGRFRWDDQDHWRDIIEEV